VLVDERGFITVDKQQRTNVPHIFAIGDVVGQPMLAHKAMHEGKVAAEVAAGKTSFFDAKVIPSVAYTDPRSPGSGVTENEAKAAGLKYGKGVFPWARTAAHCRSAATRASPSAVRRGDARIIGCGIVGPTPGAHRRGRARRSRWAPTRRHRPDHPPHPTLSETIGMAAEAFEGTITDLYLQRGKPSKKKALRRHEMPGSVIVGGARTPIGKLAGSLKDFSAMDLGGFAIKAALEKAGVTGDQSTT
jgi:dihydrolipoamide dehydrogenase